MFISFFALWGISSACSIRAKRRVNSASHTRYAQMCHHRVDHLRAWKDSLRIEKNYLRLGKTIYGSKRLFTAWGCFCRIVSLFLMTWGTLNLSMNKNIWMLYIIQNMFKDGTCTKLHNYSKVLSTSWNCICTKDKTRDYDMITPGGNQRLWYDYPRGATQLSFWYRCAQLSFWYKFQALERKFCINLGSRTANSVKFVIFVEKGVLKNWKMLKWGS